MQSSFHVRGGSFPQCRTGEAPGEIMEGERKHIQQQKKVLESFALTGLAWICSSHLCFSFVFSSESFSLLVPLPCLRVGQALIKETLEWYMASMARSAWAQANEGEATRIRIGSSDGMLQLLEGFSFPLLPFHFLKLFLNPHPPRRRRQRRPSSFSYSL